MKRRKISFGVTLMELYRLKQKSHSSTQLVATRKVWLS